MFKHEDIWKAIDLLAESHGLSTSGLARKAGLDATTFNKSKRVTSQGKPRWPSTESLSKVLEITGEGLETVSSFIGSPANHQTLRIRIPVIGCARAGEDGFFDDAGYPAGEGWDELDFPNLPDRNCYALEVSGNSMEPLYRDGDILVVSPDARTFRKGDRVVTRTADGQVVAKELIRITAKKVTLRSLNSDYDDMVLERAEVDWIARILWVSQ